MIALKVYNVITKETAAMFGPADRPIANKLVETLRRNGKRAGEHGAYGWTVVEISNVEPDEPGNDNEDGR
jgi:hypothetical protein